jgi:hypothetical protein
MGAITGLVADPHRHDHLLVSIDRHLAVVALNPAASAFYRASALAASARCRAARAKGLTRDSGRRWLGSWRPQPLARHRLEPSPRSH